MLKLKVITPDKLVYDETVTSVSVPTTSGMITVLDKHSPLVSMVRSGELTIRKDESEVLYAIFSGLVTVRPHIKGLTEVIVLLEHTERVDEMDTKITEEALQRAREAAKVTKDDHDFEHFQSLIERELSKVKIARKYKG
jgi:F-type H+-transporting ATPase subunit epsilon